MNTGDQSDNAWVEQEISLLTELGPRLTASPAQERLIEHVAAQLAETGLVVHEDLHTITRWDLPATDAGLGLSIDGHAVKVASAFPYSGKTGSRGVTATAHRLAGPLPRWSAARDGIAVVEVRNRTVPFGAVVGTWDDPDGWGRQANPLIPATIAGMGLNRARRAGVRGVIFVWRGITEANAQGQYIPFTLPYLDIPAVFVAGDAADEVLTAARHHRPVTLVLDATLTPDSPTRSIWAVAPGTERPDETILVVSHSDGTNTVEENGHIGLVQLARQVQANRTRRSIVFVFVTGHLRIPALADHGQATTRWLRDHPDEWSGEGQGRRAVAGLAIEHLGARQFREELSTGHYGPTGGAESELLYATTREMKTLVDLEWRGARPGPPRVSAPSALIHFGEGEPLYQHQIPGIALVTAPQYLLSTRQDDYVDTDVLLRQVDSFHRLLRRLDTLPTGHFGTVTPPGPTGKILTVGKIIAGLLRR